MFPALESRSGLMKGEESDEGKKMGICQMAAGLVV